jgi:hypothetical protein
MFLINYIIMKYCLYYDINSISTLYIYQQLKNKFKKLGHILEIYIPVCNNQNGVISKSIYKKYYNVNSVKWGFPESNKYDILMIINGVNLKINGFDNRLKLCKQFKKTIYLKADSTREYWCLGAKKNYEIIPNIKHGICTPLDLIYPKSDWLNHVPNFELPFLENLTFEKNNCLSLEDFKQKYNIPNEKKIILCAFSKFSKLIGIKSNSEYEPQIKWLYQNLKLINQICNQNGYQLVAKLHKMEYLKKCPSPENKYYQDIPIIDDFDSHEAIKYADYAFTCGSMIVLEFSLYGLPCLEFCVEKVFSFQKPDINKIKDMIYGDCINFNKIKDNTKTEIATFLQSEFNKPNEIPYYKNCNNVNLSDIVNKIVVNS